MAVNVDKAYKGILWMKKNIVYFQIVYLLYRKILTRPVYSMSAFSKLDLM
jgi:hypothetical protein